MHGSKSVWRSGRISPHILSLGTRRGEWSASPTSGHWPEGWADPRADKDKLITRKGNLSIPQAQSPETIHCTNWAIPAAIFIVGYVNMRSEKSLQKESTNWSFTETAKTNKKNCKTLPDVTHPYNSYRSELTFSVKVRRVQLRGKWLHWRRTRHWISNLKLPIWKLFFVRLVST
jgi:hypothetical protein